MPARFKLDENLPRDAEAMLRNAGHDVQTVFDEQLDGHPDSEVFEACRRESRILITLDRGLADVRFYPPAEHSGVWLLRPSDQSIDNTLALLRTAVAVLDVEAPERQLWIIEPSRIRVRL